MVLVLGLGVFGIFAIYSATWMREQDFWNRQMIWLLVGLIICGGVSLIDYHWVRLGALPLYLAGLGALLFTHFFGQEVFGARSWINLGFMNFQPSQLAILSAIMVLALFLSNYQKMPSLLRIALCGMVAAAPGVLILIQPDLGSAILWGPILLAML